MSAKLTQNFYLVGFLLLSIFFVGCSSDDKKEEPAELKDIVSEAAIEVNWKRQDGDGNNDQYLFLQPAYQNDRIYTIDQEGRIVCVDKESGMRVWWWDADELISGGISIEGNRLYYTTFNGELVALDITYELDPEGESKSDNESEIEIEPVKEVWRKRLSSEAIAPPQANRSIIVVQTINGRVTAFDKSKGESIWAYQSSSPLLSLRGTATPLVNDEYTIAGFANGELVQIDNNTGKPQWQRTVNTGQGRTELERLVDIDGSPKRFEGTVYAAPYRGEMVAIDYFTGNELWTKTLSSYVGVTNDFTNVYVSTSQGEVVALDRINRKEIWRNKDLSYRRLTSPVELDSYLVVGDYEGYIHVFSKSDGRIVARKKIDSDGLRVPISVLDSKLFIYGNSGVLASISISSSL